MSNFYDTLAGQPLQHFFKIEIETVGDSKYVHFHSTIHVNKKTTLRNCFSTDFSDYEILHSSEVLACATQRYGGMTK